MDIIVDAFKLLGSLICHQIPSRTLSVDGAFLPFCARDTGIYLGIFASAMYIVLRRRANADRMPCMAHSIVLCLLMVPMLLDGATSYLGLRESENGIRLFTGAYFGMPIPFFLMPAANFKVEGDSSKPVVENIWEIIVLFGFVNLISFAVLSGVVPWMAISGALAAGFLFLVFRTVYTVVVRTRPSAGWKQVCGATIVYAVAVLGLMYVLSNIVLKPFKNLFQGV